MSGMLAFRMARLAPARRGLGSNLYRLGVPEIVIQRILRHANVSTTATYYIKTAADDVRSAMAKLESQITVGSSGYRTLMGHQPSERHLSRALFSNLPYAAK